MAENRINLARDKSTGRTEQSHSLDTKRGAMGGGGYIGETRAEIVSSLYGLIKNSSSPEIAITSMRTRSFSYPGYETLETEELEVIAAELRNKLENLKIVVG